MTNLHSLIKSNYIKTIKSVLPSTWKVLVCDKYSKQLLLSSLKLEEILQENITEIQDIEYLARSNPNLDAIYFLLPTSQSVTRLIRDLRQPERIYQSFYVYFLDILPKPLEQRIIESGVVPKLSALSDLSTNFKALESRAFLTNQPTAFNSFFAHPTNIPAADVQVGFIVKGLLNILTILNIYPQIRYQIPLNAVGTYANPQVASGDYRGVDPAGPPVKRSAWKSAFTSNEKGSGVCRRVALVLEKELSALKRQNPDFGVNNSSINNAPPILLLTDRTLDLNLPLIHEFNYQSLTIDVLPERTVSTIDHPPIFNFKSTAQAPVGSLGMKSHTLSDKTDSIWADIRHLHMKDAIDKVGELTREAEAMDSDFKDSKGLDGLRSMLAGLTDLQEIKEKAFVHTTLSGFCMAEVSNRHLMEVSDVEQCCATGQTADGKSPRHLIEHMVPLLDLPHITQKDKIRIIALYIMFKDGVSDEDKRRLYQHAKLGPTEQESIDNLVQLGVRISKNDSDQQSFRKAKYRGKTPEDCYDTSRYVPILKTCLLELLNGKLDSSSFPRMGGLIEEESNGAHEPPSTSLRTQRSSRPSAPKSAPSQGSLRSARATWATASRSTSSMNTSSTQKANLKENNDDLKKQKVIVFVCGGMMYSEIKSVYEVANSANKDVLIGSTNVFTPNQFIDNLRKLGGGYMYGSGATMDSNFKFSSQSTALGRTDPYMYTPKKELSEKAPPVELSQEEIEMKYYGRLQEAYDRKYFSEDIKPPTPPPTPQQLKQQQSGKPIKPTKDEKKDEKKLKKEQKEIEKQQAKLYEIEKKKEKKWGKKGWF